MEYDKLIKATRRSRKPSFDTSKRSRNKLNIANQEWLTFEVRNKELVIKKISDAERSMKTNGESR